MLKTRKKHLKALLIGCVFAQWSFAQAKGGLENYHFLQQGQAYVWMPVMHYESVKGWYGELRYNYEDLKTISLYAGKRLGIGTEKNLSFTPMLGFSTGYFEGVSFALKTDFERERLYVSLESQYSHSFDKGYPSFFFNWSEVGYSFSRNFFGGLSLQYTRQEGYHVAEPGIMGGLSFGNVTIPVYLFNPFQKRPMVIIGLNYEYQIKKR